MLAPGFSVHRIIDTKPHWLGTYAHWGDACAVAIWKSTLGPEPVEVCAVGKDYVSRSVYVGGRMVEHGAEVPT